MTGANKKIGIIEVLFDPKNTLPILILLSLIGLALRCGVLFTTAEIPGDGPAHAIAAYDWSKAPFVLKKGVWLPGFTVLSGFANRLFPEPLIASRIVNVIVGTLTIPLFFLLIKKIYNHSAALFSAALLMLFPLHVGLSATSLTEPSFLFEFAACILLFITACETSDPKALYASVFFLILASMTRYESWIFLPLLPAFYFFRIKKTSKAIFLALILLLFPVMWLYRTYCLFGNPFAGFSAAIRGLENGAESVGLFGAFKILGHKAVSHLGWILTCAVVAGAALSLRSIIKIKRLSHETFYLLVVCVLWLVLLAFTAFRGESLWDRYLLTGFVLMLPLSALPIIHCFKKQCGWILLLVLLVFSSGFFAVFHHPHRFYVTRTLPTSIKNLVQWLKVSPYRESAILVTRMEWRASYVPLYYPEADSRLLIVSGWLNSSDIVSFIQKMKPDIVITSDDKEDKVQLLRIESILNTHITNNDVIYRDEHTLVYPITQATHGSTPQGAAPASAQME